MKTVESACWCKICGITSPEDASAVVGLGVDSIGLNFYKKSPRFITNKKAIDIVSSAENCFKVALFVDPTTEEVENVLNEVDIDGLQFHGDESKEFCEGFGKQYIKAIKIGGDSSYGALEDYHPGAWAILVDSYVQGLAGGTGKTFDWESWPKEVGRRLILSGGLTAENVAAGIRSTKPFGVDVSSGVEGVHKGIKNIELVEKFMQEIRIA
jgi:phosphoribosylanthranilate isomerase